MRITSVGGPRPPNGGKARLVPAQRSRIERAALAAGPVRVRVAQRNSSTESAMPQPNSGRTRKSDHSSPTTDRRQRSRAHLQATLQDALCLAVADNIDEGQRVLAPALRTFATVGVRRLLIDEGPQMLRLAKDAAVAG